jgi:hypothetical protein
MSNRLSQSIAVAAGYCIGIAAYGWLPPVSIVPGHSMVFGRPLLAFLLPTTALAITVMAHTIWNRDRTRQSRPEAASTHEAILSRTILFIVSIHAAVILGLLSVAGVIGPIELPLVRIVSVLLGLLFVTVGNLLPRTEPNLVIGIRMRRAMANACVWKDIHRLTGYVSVALGTVLMAVGAITSGRQIAQVAGGAGMAALIVIASYAYSRARTGHV